MLLSDGGGEKEKIMFDLLRKVMIDVLFGVSCMYDLRLVCTINVSSGV